MTEAALQFLELDNLQLWRDKLMFIKVSYKAIAN